MKREKAPWDRYQKPADVHNSSQTGSYEALQNGFLQPVFPLKNIPNISPLHCAGGKILSCIYGGSVFSFVS